MQELQKFKKTELGEIPEDWEISTVESFLRINMGQSPPSETYNLDRKGLPFYQGVSDFGDIFPKSRIWCSNPQKIANKNEILFSVRAPVGEINITDEKCCIGRGVSSLIPVNSDLKYCFYILKFFKNKFIAYSQGSTFEAINRDKIGKVKVPFISNIKEQHNIALILSKVDELIQKIEQIIEQTQRLKKGLMQRLLTKGIGHTRFKITELGEIPEEWDIINLEQVAQINYGLSTPPSIDKNGIPLIRATNIKNGKIIRNENLMYVNCESIPKSRIRFLKKNDIVVVRSGVYTGDIALIDEEFEGSVAGYDLIVSPNNKINPIFLTIYLSSSIVQNYFSQHKSRVAQSHLNAQQLANTKIIMPPISEQQKIASILTYIDRKINNLKVYKTQISTIKKGLMQQLLTGKIRVKV